MASLLDKLLHPDYDPEKHDQKNLDPEPYTPPEPDPITEVVQFWQEFHCKCGRTFSSPMFHPEPLQIKRTGRRGSTYETCSTARWIPSDVPTRTETIHHEINSCPDCLTSPAGGGQQIPLELDGEEQLQRYIGSRFQRKEN